MAGPSARRDIQAALQRAIERAAGRPVQVPERVRFELRRKAIHVAAAILAVPVLILLPFLVAVAIAALGIFVTAMTWAIERRRLPREFAGPMHDQLAQVLQTTRREGEDFPWSPVLYTVSLILIGLAHELFGFPWALAFAAYAILGIGDAASALVGVAYGRHKLPWNRKKSFEGTGAGVAAGFMAGVFMGIVPLVYAGMLVPPLFPLVVFAGALAGMLAETVPGTEDNFVVPLTAAAAMFLVASLLGLPPLP